jgi:transposase
MTDCSPRQSINAPPTLGPNGRVVGLDVHPDTFAATILNGHDPLKARVIHSITRQPLNALYAWAARHTAKDDVLVIEASSN